MSIRLCGSRVLSQSHSSGGSGSLFQSNMKSFTLVLAVLAMATSSWAQVPFGGRCPNVKVQQNFQLKDYLGDWFEYKKYFAIFEAGGRCITAKYSDEGNGVVGVVNRQYTPALQRYSTIMGTASLAGKEGEAKLTVKFPVTGGLGGSPYWVLGTDYKSFAVVWSCTDLYLFNFQNAWILTRERVPSAETMAAADQVMKDNNLALGPLSLTSFDSCP